ncbi:hypothetical protein BGX34_004317 [Mortierella sp. NVP85]|nr:hypothetical protein BGX34_004317 [Mortierella sp. NVP85]
MTDSEVDIPTIDAIFVVRFDTRLGNTLEWSSSVPGIQLRGVEFSALPSGLHNSSQDVIYFHLEGCIGVAVYANVPSSHAEHRGAQMVSVGVLVKPSADTGRCGQVWRHVDFLKRQANRHTDQGADTSDLADYFSTHRTTQHAAGPSSSSAKRDSYRTARNLRRISRSFTISEPFSETTSMSIGRHESVEMDNIPSSHPSQHFLKLIQAMGPSIYIIWKAALLKKRILIYTQPPIESALYNICLMATIPFEVASISQHKSTDRMQPLFCVGIHDIDHMSTLRSGYVACTTDRLFLFKPQLFDVLIDLSAPPSKSLYPAPRPAYPQIRTISGNDSKECHPNSVDKRRHFALLQRLVRYRRRQEWMRRETYTEATGDARTLDEAEETLLQESDMPELELPTEGFNMSDTLRKMVTGGWWWWWWYGGEEGEEEEQEPLLSGTGSYRQDGGSQGGSRPHSGASLQVLRQVGGSADTEAIRFFHNLTSTLLTELGRLVSFKLTTANFEGEETLTVIEVSREDLRELGLDPRRDWEFVQDLGRVYFECEMQMEQGGLLCRLPSCCCCCAF